MKIQSVSIVGLALVASTFSLQPAAAQADDVAYCKALSDKYEILATSNTDRHATFGTNANMSATIAKCRAGDASTIPALEQALKNARIDLPKRG